jgi:hypothetical protein
VTSVQRASGILPEDHSCFPAWDGSAGKLPGSTFRPPTIQRLRGTFNSLSKIQVMTDDAPLESSPPQPPPVEEAPATTPTRPVERLFPFVLRARALLIGRETLRRSKSKLHFVLITRDISEASRTEILSDFMHYPVVQHYLAEDLEKHFGIKGAKVIGFAKSGLAQSIYAELKQHRINQPVTKPKPAGPATAASTHRVGAKPGERQPRVL